MLELKQHKPCIYIKEHSNGVQRRWTYFLFVLVLYLYFCFFIVGWIIRWLQDEHIDWTLVTSFILKADVSGKSCGFIYIYIPHTHTHTHVQLWLLEGSHVGVGLCQLFPVGRLSTYFVFSMHAVTLLLLLFFLTIKVPHPSSPPPPLFHLNIFLILAPESASAHFLSVRSKSSVLFNQNTNYRF